MPGSEQPVPGPAVTASQPGLQQQFEVFGVVPGMGIARAAVVDRLAVVRRCSCLEEQPSQLQLLGVRGSPLLTATESPGQGRERRGQAVPEETRVRIGTGCEEEAGHAQVIDLTLGERPRCAAEPGIGQVQQRRPAEWPVLAVHGGGIRLEDLASREQIPGRGGRGQARAGEGGIGGEEHGRLR